MARLLDYIWPTKYFGIRDISENGKKITRERICNSDYDGPRSGIGDDEIRRENRAILSRHINVYIMRWCFCISAFCK